MSQHDHRSTQGNTGNEGPTGRFSGDDLEFSPFMFDPSQPSSGAVPGQFGGDEMEFEPFMFNPGESLGMAGTSSASSTLSTANAPATPAAPNTPAPQPEAPPNFRMAPAPGLGFEPFPMQGISHQNGVPGTMPTMIQPSQPSQPAPSQLQPLVQPPIQPLAPLTATGSEAPAPPASSTPFAPSTPTGQGGPQRMDALPNPWTTGPIPNMSGPLYQSAPAMPTQPAQTGTEPVQALQTQTEQMAAHPSTRQLESGPFSGESMRGTGPLSAPTATPMSAGPTGFTGMGRSRGNTGPLGAAPNAAWSDNSLASIEDFSSILIAMQAGKRLRQSAPLHDTAIPPAPAPSTEAAAPVPSAPLTPRGETGMSSAPGTSDADAQSIPDWAMQASAQAPSASSTTQTEPQIQPHIWGEAAAPVETQVAPAPPWPMEQWEPDLPAEPQPPVQAVEAVGYPTPALQPPHTAVAPQTQQSNQEVETQPAQSEPMDTLSPRTAPASTAVTEAARAELAAIREAPTGDLLGGLEPGVAETLKGVNPAIAEGGFTGDELQFEGFMFDQGAPAPLPSLASMEEMTPIPHDMGPVFDPSLYSTPVDVEESHEYADVDAAEFSAAVPAPMPTPSTTGAGEPESAQNALPFWLQGASTGDQGDRGDGEEARTGAADTDVAAETNMTPALAESRAPAQELAQEYTQQASPVDMGMDIGMDSIAPVGDSMSKPEYVSEDFSELPPIAPFDFSTLPTNEQPESLGFNTEELSGQAPSAHDPMIVTANLEALADLLGGYSSTGIDPRAARPQAPQAPQTSQAAQTSQAGASNVEATIPEWEFPSEKAQEQTGAPIAQAQEAAPQMVTQGMPGDASHSPTQPTQPTSAESRKSGGWMATVTTNLSMDTLSDLTGNLEGSAANAGMAVEDLEVAPFDYTELDLDIQGEAATGYLDPNKAIGGKGTAFLEPQPQPPAETSRATVPALEDVWSVADGDTSLFMTLPFEAQIEADQADQMADEVSERETPTGYPPEAARTHDTASTSTPPMLDIDEPTEPTVQSEATSASMGFMETAPEMQDTTPPTAPPNGDESIFRARVARGPWGEEYNSSTPAAPVEEAVASPVLPSSPPPSQSPWESLAATTMATNTNTGVNANVASEMAAPAQPQIQFEDEAPTMATRGDVTTSGPLPSLDNFDDLIEWIERNPYDMGAHLALAAAYQQAGDIDSTLRVYKRMLRKPNVSTNVLQMIEDELDDLESQAGEHPRYHQARGDLLVRRGRRGEAVDEYNKLT